jgi:hypothetical protein
MPRGATIAVHAVGRIVSGSMQLPRRQAGMVLEGAWHIFLRLKGDGRCRLILRTIRYLWTRPASEAFEDGDEQHSDEAWFIA